MAWGWTYGGYYPLTGNEVLVAYRGQNGSPITQGIIPATVNITTAQLAALGAGASPQTVAAQVGGQTGAVAIPIGGAVFTSVPSDGGGILPSPAMGRIQVLNRGSNSLLVYRAPLAQIENYGINTPVSIPPGGSATFIAVSPAQWYVA